MKNPLIIILVLFSNCLFSQNQIDSLEALLPNKKGLEKVELLNKLAFTYWNVSPDKGLDYAKMAYSIALKKDSKIDIATSLQNIGTSYWAKSEFHLALEYYQKSLKIYEELNDLKGICSSFTNMGIVYRDLSDYETALKYYLKSLKTAKENGITDFHISTFGNISTLYLVQKNYPKALEYVQESIDLSEKQGDTINLAANLNTMGQIYTAQNNYKKAKSTFIKCLQIDRKNGDKYGTAISLYNLGDSEYHLKNYASALKYFKESLLISKNINDQLGVLFANKGIGHIHKELNRFDSALSFYKKAMDLAIKLDSKEQRLSIYKNYSDLYKSNGNFNKSLVFLEKFISLKDSVYTENSSKQIAEMQTKYDSEKKEKENELLRKNSEIQNLEIAKQTNLRNSFIGVSILVILMIIIFLNRYAIKKKANQLLILKNEVISNQRDELIISETRYRTLFENARDAIFLLDDRGGIINGNQAMVDLFGYDEKSEVLTLSIWDISPNVQPNGRTSKRIVLEKLGGILMGDSQLLNWDHQRKDGTIFKTEVSISALQYNDKNYILASVRDITYRVKSELALKESEEKFANAFDSSPVAQSILNLKTGRRLNVNRMFCKLFGYTREELLTINVRTSNLAVDPVLLNEGIEIALKTGRLDDFAFDMYNSKGDIRNIIISATNTFLNDEDVFIVSYTDVTNTREAEQKIKKAEKDIFNAIISSEEKERARYAKELHDGLGPILSTSLIYLHTLMQEEDKVKQTEYIKRTYALLEDATQSIREISSNLSPDILKKYGLVHAVRSFIEKLQEVSKVKFKINSNLSSEFNEITGFTLYRTITELINNTIKHANANQIVITFDQSASGIKIVYVDDGSGFDYEKAKKESNGFGLMNLEGRIKTIGGHYEFTSSKDEGTQVAIKIETIRDDSYSYN